MGGCQILHVVVPVLNFLYLASKCMWQTFQIFGTEHIVKGLTQRNVLNDQGSFSAQPTIPSHILLPVSMVTYGTINNSIMNFLIYNLYFFVDVSLYRMTWSQVQVLLARESLHLTMFQLIYPVDFLLLKYVFF